ncbi:MAG: DUF2142 domain-containing protein [Actinomycetota bacterium]
MVGRPRKPDVPWRSPWLWSALAFAFLGTTWILTTPPAGGVDEISHHIRVVGIAHGQLIGDEVELDRPFALLEGLQLRRVNAESGSFRVPGHLVALSGCNFMDATHPFECAQPAPISGEIDEISLHGKSLPGAYVIPAVFGRLGSDSVSALMWERFGMLLQVAVMAVLAAMALRVAWRVSGSPSSAAVALLASSITPVLAFLSGTVSPSAIEIWSALAAAATLIAFARTRSTRWLWTFVAVAVFTSWTRDFGAVVVMVAVVAALMVESDLRAWCRTSGPRPWITASIVTFGVVSALIWQAIYKYPLRPSIGSPRQVVDDVVTVLRVLRQGIGLGGWLNVPMNSILEGLWLAGWLGSATFIVCRARPLVRLVLLGIGLVIGAAGLYLVAMMRVAGFVLQARFLMPLLMVAVVVAVTSPLRQGATRVFEPWVLRAVFTVIGLSHVSALLINAHRHARGLNANPIDFSPAVWDPPGGWTLAMVLGSCGGLCVLVIPWCRRTRWPVTQEHRTLS